VKGVIFGKVPVEVECKLVAPRSYTTSDVIPLHLTLTSENQEALDLFSVSHVIDVRLEKVLAFGRDASVIRPLTLWDRRSYHRSDLAATAHWKLDGHTTELSPDNEHSRSRWCIKMNGSLHREINVELCPSFEEPGMALAIMYIVCLFPFRSADFRPEGHPKKALVMGKIRLTSPRTSIHR